MSYISFIKLQSTQSDKDYLSSTIAYWTAPTITKRKPATILSFSHQSRDLYRLWELYKEEIVSRLHLEYFEIRKCSKRVLVIFFNRTVLLKTLLKPNNRNFLNTIGYPGGIDLNTYLILLQRQFEITFPHEVGIFLGIPLEDVESFIAHRGKGCLLNSYWKVYHDTERAKSIFASYDRAREDVISAMNCK